MLDAFEAIKAVGGVAQVHAESGDVVEREERAMIQRGITGTVDESTDGFRTLEGAIIIGRALIYPYTK